MLKTRDKPLYQHVIEDIRRRVFSRRLKPGDQLPALTEMCRLYGVSAITARRAVQELKAAGLVNTFNGKGIFIKGAPQFESAARAPQQQPPARLSRITVVWAGGRLVNAPDCFLYRVWEGISFAAHECGLPLSTEIIPVNLPSVPHVPFAPEPEQGVIVLGPMMSPFVFSILDQPDLASVLVDSTCIGACCVLTDNFSGVRQALTHLKELGHRHVAFSGNFSWGWNSANENERHDAFVRLTREMGMQGEAASDQGHDALCARLKAPGAPTAVLFSREECALDFLRVARRRRLRVPGDVSVVGFDGYFPAALAERLTTLRVDRDGLGKAAVRRLMSLTERPRERCQWTRVEPELVIGTTTASPAPAGQRRAARR